MERKFNNFEEFVSYGESEANKSSLRELFGLPIPECSIHYYFATLLKSQRRRNRFKRFCKSVFSGQDFNGITIEQVSELNYALVTNSAYGEDFIKLYKSLVSENESYRDYPWLIKNVLEVGGAITVLILDALFGWTYW